VELGQLYANAEQVDQAVLHFRKALEVEPGNVRARLNLGDTLLRARRYAEALAEANAVLANDAKNPYALDIKGRAQRETKDYEGALATADQLLGQDAKNPKAVFLKVTIAEAKRDYALAAGLLEGLIARTPAGEEPAEAAANDRVFLVHLGFAYQQLERYGDAAEASARPRPRASPTPASPATASRRCSSPRTTTRASPRRRPRGHAFPRTPTSRPSRRHCCARRETSRRRSRSSTPCARRARRT
jgi:tetratricopeptide (TPR) repeat protein